METIREITNPQGEFYKSLTSLAKGELNKFDGKTNEINALSEEIKKNERDIESLIDRIKLVPAEIVPEIGSEIAKLKNANKVLEDKLKELNVDKNTIISDSENAKIVLDVIDKYVGKFDELDLLAKRTIVKLLISSAYSDGEKLILNLVGTRNTLNKIELPTGDNSK